MDPLSFGGLAALLVLNRLGSRRQVIEWLDGGMSSGEAVEKIFSAETESRAVKAGLKGFDPDREIRESEKMGFRLMGWPDPDYPRFLREIPDPPLVLYMAGFLEEPDAAAAAVVGSRHPSFYGLEQTRRFARDLSQNGLTVVSGFAQGIDRAAHEGALEIPYGRTLAVLGCGLDVDYPAGHRRLFERIRERGAVLTEYGLGTPPRPENFPKRNRIIAGLALGVLVVEANARSGSLITAHQALEQGREVFAIPGPVDRPGSRGTNRLIKEGAHLTEDPGDILEVLAGSLRPLCRAENVPGGVPSEAGQEAPDGPTDTEEIKLTGLLKKGGLAFESLCEEGGFDRNRLAALLTRCEIGKRIKKNHDGRYVLTGCSEGGGPLKPLDR